MTRAHQLLGGLAVLSVAAPSLAAERGYTIEVLPSACPLDAAFEQAVDARLDGDVVGPEAHVQVAIESRGTEYVARMRLEQPGRAPAVREFPAEQCDEAASALATVVAIALQAIVEPEPAKPERPVAKSAPVSRPSDVDPAPVWHGGAGAEFTLDLSLSPGMALGGRIFASLRRGASGPAFRAFGGYRAAPGAEVSDRRFDVSLLALAAEGCPIVARVGAAIDLEPCLTVEVGRYRAVGTEGFERGEERFLLWTSAGIVGRGRASLAGGWSWELSAQALFPMQNQMLLVADLPAQDRSIVLFDAPWVSALLATGFKLDFQ